VTQINTRRADGHAVLVPEHKGICMLGAAAAITAVLLFLADIAISAGGGDMNPGPMTAIDWFGLFQANSLSGLRMLGIINIASLIICIPLYFALYTVHRQFCRSYAALALILYLLGAAIYISNNAAIPMYVLNSKYMAASAEAQKALLAAGEAIVAKGADFTPGSFIGFFLTELAGIAFSMIMLSSGIFGKTTAFIGIMGFLFLSVFTIWMTFNPVFFDVAMIIAMLGGLMSTAWYILAARGLTKLGKSNFTQYERRLS